MQSIIHQDSEVAATDTHAHRPLTESQLNTMYKVLLDSLVAHRVRLDDSQQFFASLVEDSSADASERSAARLEADRDFDALRSINLALASIDSGDYGTCVVCSQPIPFERLEVIPTTPTCVSCPDP